MMKTITNLLQLTKRWYYQASFASVIGGDELFSIVFGSEQFNHNPDTIGSLYKDFKH